MHGCADMIVGRIDNIISRLLDTTYKKHKQITSSIANIIEDSSKNEKKEIESKTLESYMAELMKNTSKYNAATRFLNIRNKIYETSIKGR